MAFANKSDWIWWNGAFVPWDEANVHITAHALHYGSSVFEGIRAYATPDGPAVFRLEPHVQRMVRSCRVIRIDLPYSTAEIGQAILDTVARNGHDSCYIRPLVFRGSEVLGLDPRKCPVEVVIITWEWGRYLGPEAIEQGVDVMVSSWRRMAPDTLPAMAKIGGQYVNSQLISLDAKLNGFAEAIALDNNGYVCEGPGENLFAVVEGKVLTPPLWASVLPGITRDCVMTLARDLGYEVREEMLAREMLYMADELFFTGTAAEISPIRSVDHIQIGNGKRGPVTAQLQEAFFGIIEGRTPDKYGWLTPVRANSSVPGSD
ncbi:MAG: branched-chain amino acid transaminase [Anaerolineae bacterium]|nr:branched-chain amino acid transaminase [Anaerolineae bacterium]